MGRGLFDFNKQLLFAEIGAFAGAPFFANIASNFTDSINFISYLSVIGAIVGGAIFWVATRVYDQNKSKRYSLNALANDIMYFTPAAFILAISIYYPLIFYISRFLLLETGRVIFSVIAAQAFAFFAFLAAMNCYRSVLIRFVGKKL